MYRLGFLTETEGECNVVETTARDLIDVSLVLFAVLLLVINIHNYSYKASFRTHWVFAMCNNEKTLTNLV